MRRALLLTTSVLFIGCVEVSVDRPTAAQDRPVRPAVEPVPPPQAEPEPTPSPRAEPAPEPTPAADAPSEPAPAFDESKFPQPKVASARPAGTKLIDAGEEPRVALRMTPAKGFKQSVGLAMDMSVAMGVGSQQVPPTSIPGVGVVLDLEVESTGPSIVYRFKTRNARREDVDAGSSRVAQAVDQAVAGLAEARGSITVSALGETQSVDLELAKLPPSGMKPAILGFRQSFSQLFPTFPKEPVGVGAAWKTVSHFETDNMRIQQVTQYVLRQKKDSRVQLSVQFEQVATAAGEQDLGDAKLDVNSYAGHGQGSIIIELDAIAPKKAQSRSLSSSISKVQLGGGTQSLALKTDLSLDMAEVTSAH